MASVTSDSNGTRRVLFFDAEGNRRAIYLGKRSKGVAQTIALKVADIVSASTSGGPRQKATDDWLADISDEIHAKLANVGLVSPRDSSATANVKPLGAFIDAYVAGRTDIKPNTAIGLGQARRNLVAFFGAGKNIAEITEGDAEDYWRYLVGPTPKGVGLAINTARRLAGRAKQFFRYAVRKQFIKSNPFVELKTSVNGSAADRKFHITRDIADKVMQACPTAEWRLIFALSRYGGLRCPSEHLSLKWSDVDFDKKRIRVPSPKTEHIEGRASRMIPMFPELEKPLLEVYGQAPEGSEYVISRFRNTGQNLRTQFTKIVRRSGLEPWPKLFHAMRATRETELAEIFPIQTVTAWIGNTPDVARRHYLSVTEDHFAKATASAPTPASDDGKDSALAAHKTAHSRPISANQGSSVPSEDDEKTPENADNPQNPGSGGWPLSELNRYALTGIGF